MVVANFVDGRVLIVDRIREMVRLAGGLDENRYLNKEAMAIALQCLEKFGQRIAHISSGSVRAVGTNTLRQARNGREFLTMANKALGHKIEIISGREEARLIYLGVANTLFNETDKRLVVDIGGGSTELIIGKGFKASLTESLLVGCVSINQRYFGDGKITTKRMGKAHIAVLQELESIQEMYRIRGWHKAIGTSGTINAVLNVLRGQGWGNSVITVEALSTLRRALIKVGNIDHFQFGGLSQNRIPVFAGGVVILSAVFEALNIKTMEYSDGALREGLLYDQIGRQHYVDVRHRTIDQLMKQYHVDEAHAGRIEKMCRTIFSCVQFEWKLDEENDLKTLCWAACLHEIGLALAHSQYHKHGAYLLGHSDMPGFSWQEQLALSILVRLHRRKIAPEVLEEAADDNRHRLLKMVIILRLATLLNRSRTTVTMPDIDIAAKDKKIRLIFRKDWLSDHPLTEADLETEAAYLSVVNYRLDFA